MGWCDRTTCLGWMSYCGEIETNQMKPSSNLAAGVGLALTVRKGDGVLPISPLNVGEMWPFILPRLSSQSMAWAALAFHGKMGTQLRMGEYHILRVLSN